MDQATAKAWLRAVLARHFDDSLRDNGFKRSPRGVAYTRALSEGKQRIDFELLLRPSYARDAVHLTLTTSILFPEVARRVTALLGEPLAAPLPDLVQRELLDTLIRNPPIMTFRSPEEADALAPTVERYLREGVLPHLDARRTVRDFADREEAFLLPAAKNGGTSGRAPVVVAAALLVLDEPERARALLAAMYPPDSPARPHYERVFAALPR